MAFPATRYETLYGERVVRCFPDRPASLDAMFRATIERSAEEVAIVLGEERITYRAFGERVEAVARNLVARGLNPGDRIALLLGNGLEFFYTFMAAARAGLISVPMNTRQRRPEIEFVLNQCHATAIVYAAEHEANLPERAAVPSLREVFVVGHGAGTSFSELLVESEPVDFPGVAETDTLCLLYTSGTTGKPKGAMLTHVSTIHSLIHFQAAWGLGRGEIAMLAVPASHVTGLVAIILTMIYLGGRTVVMPAFKARSFLELAAAERMSYTLIVPAMYNLCLLDPDFRDFDLSAWRVAGFGGAPMPGATIERLAEALPNLSLCNAYGSTETTSPVTLLPPGDIAKKPRSVGKMLPCADIIVVDDQGREVPPGESGELLIAGSMVVPGYWDNVEGNRNGFVGGYWVSGDIGSKDEDGYVYVFDRKKDMINRAGFKIYCIEVESVLTHHPSVVEAAVVGMPDPVLGERAHAFIFADNRPFEEADIKRFCAERLSDYKVPDSIINLGEPLPRNANGKILKTALRDLLP
ncbi:class I adenylate-forming enzyme family protein [Mesorhizobium sp. 1B3]|uniref:class I adenylate-forming enzyme family protein n=1 Tax=Mesorhizobium sp. 1B3 TaxID=3243599 RepID=UPI003D956754